MRVGVKGKVIIVDVFFFQAEDGIRDLVRSRGLGDVYKRQLHGRGNHPSRNQHQAIYLTCDIFL